MTIGRSKTGSAIERISRERDQLRETLGDLLSSIEAWRKRSPVYGAMPPPGWTDPAPRDIVMIAQIRSHIRALMQMPNDGFTPLQEAEWLRQLIGEGDGNARVATQTQPPRG